MTIKQALVWAIKKLKNSDSSQIDSKIILSFVLKKDKTHLYTYPERKLTSFQEKNFKQLITKRFNNWPIAYLIHTKEFYDFCFYVNANVLIPRPESEIIISETNKLISKYKLKTIADVGTGSGCLGLTIKKLNPNITVYATDISLNALTVAKKNSKKLSTKINFHHGNLLQPIENKQIDLVVANLPYLSYNVYRRECSIKKEPKLALLAKNKGLKLNAELLGQINQLSHQPKFTILEFEPPQKKELLQIAKKIKAKKIIIKKDLYNDDRFLIITH